MRIPRSTIGTRRSLNIDGGIDRRTYGVPKLSHKTISAIIQGKHRQVKLIEEKKSKDTVRTFY